jgi:hypothetical protein
MRKRALKKRMVCQSASGAFLHVSPRLAAIYLHIVEIVEAEPDEKICAVCMFETIWRFCPTTRSFRFSTSQRSGGPHRFLSESHDRQSGDAHNQP